MRVKLSVIIMIFSIFIIFSLPAFGKVKCALLYGPSSFPIGRLPQASVVKTPQEALAMLLRKEADVIAFPVNAAIKLRLGGKPIKLLGVYIWKTFYLLSKDPRVKDVSGVRGEVYFPHFKGTMADIMGKKIFGNRITYKYAPPMAIVSFLREGKAKFGVLPEPMASIAELSGSRIAYDLQERWGGKVPITCLITLKGILDSKRSEISAFLDSFSRAVSWAREKISLSARAFCDRLGFKSVKAIERAIRRSELKFVSGIKAKDKVLSFFKEVSPALSKVDEAFFDP